MRSWHWIKFMELLGVGLHFAREFVSIKFISVLHIPIVHNDDVVYVLKRSKLLH